MTREEISVMLWRFFHLLGLYGQVPAAGYAEYADTANISSWAAQAVDYTSAIGLFQGRDGGKFEPQSPMTRDEAIVLIKRAYEAAKPFQ